MLACTPNIGTAQRRRRLLSGAALFMGAAVLAAALAAANASIVLRSIIALPLYGAALGVLQYREKT